MHITKFITALGLATAASAIDIRLYEGRQCDRGWLQCGAIDPNVSIRPRKSSYFVAGEISFV
jgi:hypothetical protein